jgi:hypothetical protein
MGPESIVLLIPIAAILMAGLVKISRYWGPGYQGQGAAAVKQLEARLESVEQELASLQQELSETQERLDFAERLLAQAREGKRLASPE